MSRRQEPYWVRVCPVCERQMRSGAERCCRWELCKTVYCVPDDLYWRVVKAGRALHAEVLDALRSTHDKPDPERLYAAVRAWEAATNPSATGPSPSAEPLAEGPISQGGDAQ